MSLIRYMFVLMLLGALLPVTTVSAAVEANTGPISASHEEPQKPAEDEEPECD